MRTTPRPTFHRPTKRPRDQTSFRRLRLTVSIRSSPDYPYDGDLLTTSAVGYIWPMCNLYSQTRNVEAIRRLFRVPHNRAARIDPQPAIFPGWTAPVIRKAEDGERELVPMSWGFVLLQDGRAPRRVTNVRDDKILTAGFGGHRSSSAGASSRRRAIASPIAGNPPNGIGSPSMATRTAVCSRFRASGSAGTAR